MDKRIDTVKTESGLSNINIDCNSKEGKMLVEVVEKESSLKKIEDKQSSIFYFMVQLRRQE